MCHFDLPTAGGIHEPVIAVYNDSLRHLFGYYSRGDGINYSNLTEQYGSFLFTTDVPPGKLRQLTPGWGILPEKGEFVKLTWRPKPEPDLAGYNIYRRELDSLRYVLIGTTTVNYYIDTLVQAGRTYIYRGTAFDTLNLESDYSDSVIVEYGPRKVNNPFATAYNNGRKIVSNSTGDKIYFVYANNGSLMPSGIYYSHSLDSGTSFLRFSDNKPFLTFNCC